MHQDRLKYLLNQYFEGVLSQQENEELNGWFNNLSYNEHDLEKWIEAEGGTDPMVENLLERFKQKRWGTAKVRNLRFTKYISIAAAVLVFAAFGTWFYYQTNMADDAADKQLVSAPKPEEYIKPGTDKATLMLSSGKVIDLDQMAAGQIVKADGLQITKTEDGQLLYRASASNSNQGYNIIDVPKGGKYQLILADGTHVWLNAASKLKYPVNFASVSRDVELIDGEAYFEVAKDKSRPFTVTNNQQVVTVLGTHFNINSYADAGGITTTLLEGSVKVAAKNSSQSSVLQPGQQSFLSAQKMSVRQADVDVAVAWKNGFFRFKDEDIYQIMSQIARWYNVDVVFKDDFTDKRFGAYISREKSITEILNIMQATKGINFKIEGRQVKVMK